MRKHAILGAVALLMSLASCSKDEVESKVAPQQKTDLVYTGDEVPLNLEAEIEEEELRSVVYDYKNTLTAGRTPKLELPSKVPVRVYVREKSDYAGTISTVTLNGAVEKKGESYRIRILGTVRLRKPGQSLKNGSWQVLCAIGGKSFTQTPENEQEDQLDPGRNANFDHVTMKVDPTAEWTDPGASLSTYAGNTVSYSDEDDSKILSRMPWMTNWSDLKVDPTAIEVDGAGQNLSLVFRPKGILLRIQPRSNMNLDLELRYIKISQEEENLYFGGNFDMLQDHQDFPNQPYVYPTFMPAYSNSPAKKFVEIKLTDAPVLKAGEELKRTIYVWAMPTKAASKQTKKFLNIELKGYTQENREPNIFSDAKNTSLYLGIWNSAPHNKEAYSKNTNYALSAAYTTRQSVNSFESGHTYTFKPILSSDLLISEVIVRPASVPKSNAENDPESGATYTSTWGGVELYNPTLTPINLSDYGLYRVKAMKADRKIEYYRFEAHPSNGTFATGHAVVQPLTLVDGEASKTMNGTSAPEYTTSVRSIYGTFIPNATLLEPGKTAVILDASYVRYAGTRPSAINVDNVISIGEQLDQAYNRHHCQFVVALDNGKNKSSNKIDWRSNDSPVLAGGPQDAYTLVKKNSDGTYRNIDVSGVTPHEHYQLYDDGTHYAAIWSGSRYALWGARHGREGNVRTRFVPAMTPFSTEPSYNEWGFTPSLERGNDYINNFSTLGSRFWLGPTEKSRLLEWSSAPFFQAPPTRKWRLQD